MPKLSYSVREAVEVSGLPRNRIYQAIRDGALTCLDLPGDTRIAHADLEAYVLSLRKAATTATATATCTDGSGTLRHAQGGKRNQEPTSAEDGYKRMQLVYSRLCLMRKRHILEGNAARRPSIYCHGAAFDSNRDSNPASLPRSPIRSAQSPIHSGSSFLVNAIHEMGIQVHCDRDAGVPKHAHYNTGMHSLRNQHRGTVMSEVV